MKSFSFLVIIFSFIFSTVPSRAEIGVTDTEVVIGAHTTESGPLATTGAPFPITVSAYFDMINKKGGINGRKIKWIHIDTQSLAPKTVEAVRQLVEQDKVFAVVGGSGASHMAVVRYLSDRGIPDLYFPDGSALYDDPKFKMAFPFYPSWVREGELDAKWVTKNKKGKKACFLVAKDSSGEEFEKGAKDAFEKYNAQASPAEKIAIGDSLRVERTAIQGDTEVLNFKDQKCDVILTSMYGPLVPNAINYGFRGGYKPIWMISTYNVSEKFISLLDQGAAEGILSAAQFARQKSMAQNKKGWKEFEDFLNKNKIPVGGTPATGYTVAEAFVETLRRAGKNLTRESIVKAAEGFNGDWSCSLCVKPLNSSKTNHRPFGAPQSVQIQKGEWHFIE